MIKINKLKVNILNNIQIKIYHIQKKKKKEIELTKINEDIDIDNLEPQQLYDENNVVVSELKHSLQIYHQHKSIKH